MIKTIIIVVLIWYAVISTIAFFIQRKMFNDYIANIEAKKDKPKHRIEL